MPSLVKPPEPWHTLLGEVDSAVGEAVELFCLGGFVMTVIYGMQRPTADVDFLEITPPERMLVINKVAGRDSPLSASLRVYLDHATAVQYYPDSYKDRVKEIFPSCYKHIKLYALDPYDLALSKLQRNIQRDRDDVKYLAKAIPLDTELLERRYREEMRPYIPSPDAQDLTIELWKDMIREEQSGTATIT